MNKENLRKAYILNIVTALTILFSVVWMFSGIKFFVEETELQASKLAMFKYYTVDSNVIMGITTMLIYAVYYVINCIVHSEGNVVTKGYDWYGFFALGLKSGVIVLPVIILITYGISFFLWKINRSRR